MALDNIARDFLYAGAIVLFLGIFTLSMLQLSLIRRFRKSLFTFISVLSYPSNELTDMEKLIRKVGVYLSLIGSITVLISGFGVWLSK